MNLLTGKNETNMLKKKTPGPFRFYERAGCLIEVEYFILQEFLYSFRLLPTSTRMEE